MADIEFYTHSFHGSFEKLLPSLGKSWDHINDVRTLAFIGRTFDRYDPDHATLKEATRARSKIIRSYARFQRENNDIACESTMCKAGEVIEYPHIKQYFALETRLFNTNQWFIDLYKGCSNNEHGHHNIEVAIGINGGNPEHDRIRQIFQEQRLRTFYRKGNGEKIEPWDL